MIILKIISFFVFIFGTYLTFKMWTSHVRKKRLKQLMDQDLPEQHHEFLKKFGPYQNLSPEEKKRFCGKLQFFLEDKNISGVGDLTVTEEMKFIVAAEACIMITNIEGDVYPGLKNIYLMEDVFIPKDNPVNSNTGLPTHSARLGEAWKRGPIVLSWRSITQGSSVIYHEFSHQLDQQDGNFDGTPELAKMANYDRWASVMGKAFFKLRKRVASHKGSRIDPYGSTNEAEFFAVTTEYFFTKPKLLKQHYPGVYDLYKGYFKQDPAEWPNG